MSDTSFTNGVTLTDADWFNDVNRLHYTILGDPANLAALRTTLAASDTAIGGLEIAVQSEMEAGSSAVLAVTPGRQHFHPSALKFWGKCGVAGDLASPSFNIASVADRGPGQVDVVIATDMSSGNYAVWAQTIDSDSTTASPKLSEPVGQAAGGFTIDNTNMINGNLQDPSSGYLFGGAGDHA